MLIWGTDRTLNGALAQLIERGIRIAEVAGLIPARSTIDKIIKV